MNKNNSFSLKGKDVVITGGGSGIGFSIAKECMNRGASLVILIDKDKEKLSNAKKYLEEYFTNTSTMTWCADFTDESMRTEFNDMLKNKKISPYFLVNCLGSTFSKTFNKGTWNEVQQILQLNLLSMVHLCHCLLPEMVARNDGAILNISSTSALIPCPGLLCYSASKAFMNNFSETLAIELKKHGILVKYACPGATDTDFFVNAGMNNLDYVKNVHKMSSDYVARRCIELMSKERPGVVVGFKNKLNMFISSLMPWRLLHTVISLRFG